MQNKTKIKIFFSIVAGIVFVIFANYIFSEVVSLQGNLIKRVYVRDVLVKAELVKSETRMEKGLSGRADLPEGRGMLFMVPSEDDVRFWMKDMRFAIDIIWIQNSRVAGCEKNISPNDSRIFTSPSTVQYVLEVPEGFCDRRGIKINDEVKI